MLSLFARTHGAVGAGGRWQGPQAAQLQRSTHHPHCTQSRPQGQRRAAANRPAGCGVSPFDDCTQQGAASAGSRPRAGSLANGTGAAHKLEACTVRGQGRWPAPGETPTRRERQAQRRADRQQRRAGGAPAGGSQTGRRALQQLAGVRARADRARLRRMGCELRTAQRSARRQQTAHEARGTGGGGRSTSGTPFLCRPTKKETQRTVGVKAPAQQPCCISYRSEAQNMYAGSGVQFPGSSLQDVLTHSISETGFPVNINLLSDARLCTPSPRREPEDGQRAHAARCGRVEGSLLPAS